ncbi:S8 family serine peptidase [Euzebya tangerina]|uniref:S8 family serine peptidase n=1 Tax=Euzebya tangerina TaxID=591198 RepID=UPI0013C31320|nr:S8 family serine peptidase [Euzebya tangerina]
MLASLVPTVAVAETGDSDEPLARDGGVVRSGSLADRAWTSDADAETDEVIPGELIVTLSAEAQNGFLGAPAWAAAGVQEVTELGGHAALISVSDDDADRVTAALRGDEGVVAVEPNVRRRYLAVPNDTSYDLQWAHQQTGIEQAWDIATGQTTRPLIAILDSGIDATHPDLDDVVISSLRSANGQIIQGAASNDPCGIGHGTAVGGVAAAEGDNGYGVAGVLWSSRVIDVALTSPENNCPPGPSDADTIAAINYVSSLPEPPLALNLSLGSTRPGCSIGYQTAVDRARAAGIVVVAAAGNDGSSGTSIPASCDGVISVGATDLTRDLAGYSQRNPQVDLVAPGGNLTATSCPTFEQLVAETVVTVGLDNSTQLVPGCSQTDPTSHRLRGITGTSFAAPYVTAAVGLLRQVAADAGNALSVDQVEGVLEQTATDLGDPGRDCSFGWGLLDLPAAMAAVQSGSRPTPEVDAPIGTGTCRGSGPGVEIIRVAAAGGDTTAPVTQAVAISQAVIPAGAAPQAVLARVDDFADALAGSGLGFGLGPLLYTSSTGSLDPATAAELRRVLDFSGAPPTVYVMGGVSAIPAGVDGELEALGARVVRLAGTGREQTAALASAEIERLTQTSARITRNYAFVAYGRGFADAVAAGQMSAYYGIPVLLTNTQAPLHPETVTELARLQPDRVIVLGGTAVVSDAIVQEIAQRGYAVERAAGGSRVDTAIQIASLYVDEQVSDISAAGPSGRPNVVAVNLRNNFNDVLAASLLGGNRSLFLPLEGEDGSIVTPAVQQAFCDFGGPLIVVGGRDVVTDAGALAAGDVLAGTGC